MDTIVHKTCTKKRVLLDVEGVLNPIYPNWWIDSAEQHAKLKEKWLESLSKELGVKIYIRRQYEIRCTACNKEYEPDVYDDGVEHCAYCGATFEVVR